MKKRPAADRFWEKVDAGGDCWQWVGATDRAGYGSFWDGARVVAPHRWVWEHLVGTIPDGLTIDHLCSNRGCVNPDHMEPVTLAENIRRGGSPSTQHRRKTHCPKGHPYSGDNLIRDSGRRCRICTYAKNRRNYQRAREAGKAWAT